jgi:MarR family 2-MHQ and catechol resistance regulon transcriptional repressor
MYNHQTSDSASIGTPDMPNHHRGSAAERRSLDAFVKLMRCANALSGALAGPLHREFGLTESQLAVLETLLHLGPLSQGVIGEKILRSGSNVTTVVDNLERGGLVRRDRDADDRRIQVVSLTAAGYELIGRAFPVHATRVDELMNVLTPTEQAQLARLCRKLGRSTAG